MNYIIKQVDGAPNWDTIESISISKYNWGGKYRPNASAKLCYIKQDGFSLQISCEESNPKSVYFHNDEPVYKDSCLEFFVNFKPQTDGSGYLNFEGNANGALLCGYGPTKNSRNFLKDLKISPPRVKSLRENNLWGYELFIPLSLIQKVYGNLSFETGVILKGNFFKCGDETELPHYGSWTKINHPTPNFHLPEFFGTLEMG